MLQISSAYLDGHREEKLRDFCFDLRLYLLQVGVLQVALLPEPVALDRLHRFTRDVMAIDGRDWGLVGRLVRRCAEQDWFWDRHGDDIRTWLLDSADLSTFVIRIDAVNEQEGEALR